MYLKVVFPCALLILLGPGLTGTAQAALYVWQDAGGRFHYTDDLAKVPESQHKTAREVHPEAAPAVPDPPPAPPKKKRPKAPRAAKPQPSLLEKAQAEARNRHKARLKKEIEALRQSLTKEQAKLDAMGRVRRFKWGIYDSQKEIVEGYQKLIKKKEDLLQELGSRIEAFPRKAEK